MWRRNLKLVHRAASSEARSLRQRNAIGSTTPSAAWRVSCTRRTSARRRSPGRPRRSSPSTASRRVKTAAGRRSATTSFMGTRSGSWRCRAAGSTTGRAAFRGSGLRRGTGGAWWRRWWTSAIRRRAATASTITSRRVPTTSWMFPRPCGMRSGWLLGNRVI
ncbi:unnamed protein product [Linum tenue]|uniref:Uncharacterized protein n=2 Tax=Linum tenue TaxID=586396 RepID=A0AAV0KMP0_9ROSI|nr:unnamed protein product [Linum tenue]